MPMSSTDFSSRGNKQADPLRTEEGDVIEMTMDEVRVSNKIKWRDYFLKTDSPVDLADFRGVDYYTFGDDRWNSTAVMHCKVSTQTPLYTLFGPYHTLTKQDAEPMVPGEITEMAFDLYPISIVLKKGQRIRLAIAGADRDVFAPIPGCEEPLITVERNAVYRSYIDLPTIQ